MKCVYYYLMLIGLMALTSCGELFEADEEQEEAVTATLTMDKTELELMQGDQFKIAVSLKPDDAKDKALRWESADSSVVAINADTLIAAGPGETTVTVTWVDRKVSAKATVKVLPLWQLKATAYPYDMLVFADVTVNGRAADSDCVVAAFDEKDNLRGVGQLRKDKDIDYMLIRIYSPDGAAENLALRCYDRKRGVVSEAEDPIAFSTDSKGTLSDLYKVEFE